MMFNNLSASNYDYNSNFYIAEFEDILSKIVICYYLMIDDNVRLSNNENEIRDVLLLNYLKNNNVRNKVGIVNYLFDREVPEDIGTGRTDIKIQTINTFSDTSAYYIIECKRLDETNLNGTTGLNAKYIENGICRFIANSYSTHYKINGMIGFIVQSLDISANISCINNLLEASYKQQTNTTTELTNSSIISDFNHCYCSIHNEIMIYHLMLDFSKNMAAA